MALEDFGYVKEGTLKGGFFLALASIREGALKICNENGTINWSTWNTCDHNPKINAEAQLEVVDETNDYVIAAIYNTYTLQAGLQLEYLDKPSFYVVMPIETLIYYFRPV